MITFSLYGTDACHLCEVAQEMVAAELPAVAGVRVEVIDISESDELFARYGTRIPVLRSPAGAELQWPFGAAELRGFLATR